MLKSRADVGMAKEDADVNGRLEDTTRGSGPQAGVPPRCGGEVLEPRHMGGCPAGPPMNTLGSLARQCRHSLAARLAHIPETAEGAVGAVRANDVLRRHVCGLLYA